MSLPSIKRELESRKASLAIVGLGYVGLNLALSFAKKGVNVIGADINEEKVKLIREATCPINVPAIKSMFKEIISANPLKFEVTTNVAKAVKDSRVSIIAVPTSIDTNKIPDLNPIIDSSTSVGQELKKGDLVTLESTVYPGATNKIVKPILEKESRLKAGVDFGLAYCYERVDIGNVKHQLANTPRVIGGVNRKSVDTATTVYKIIIDADLVKVRNCEIAEMAKLLENTYRDLNIAFMNEIAILCEKLEIDILDVLEAASTKWSFHPHVPGAGVGGACIPVNPYYLLKIAEDIGLDIELVRTSRLINEKMIDHVIDLVVEALNEAGKTVAGSKIAILGVAYKADVDDCRNSPALSIGNKLYHMGASVTFYDPFVKVKKTSIKIEQSMQVAINGSDCIVVAVDHSEFEKLTASSLAGLLNIPAAIVDGRHVFKPKLVKKAGLIYRGVGRTDDSNLTIWNVKFK